MEGTVETGVGSWEMEGRSANKIQASWKKDQTNECAFGQW